MVREGETPRVKGPSWGNIEMGTTVCSLMSSPLGRTLEFDHVENTMTRDFSVSRPHAIFLLPTPDLQFNWMKISRARKKREMVPLGHGELDGHL